MKRTIYLLFILLSFGTFAQEEDSFSWPKEIETAKGVATVYQPQLESLNGNIVEGRAAISYQETGSKEMDFGAFWFRATLETNTDERTAVMEAVDVVQLNFPMIEDEDRLEKARLGLENEIESWDIVFSMDHLIASLADAEQIVEMESKINNDAPEIYFRNEPTVLVSIDGDPIFKEDGESSLSYVVNSPFFLVKDGKSNALYLKGGKFWYTAATVSSQWKATSNIPRNIAQFEEKNRPNETAVDSAAAEMKSPPELLVSTTSAELVLIDGEPDYGTIKETQLLYIKNTESDVLVEIDSQKHYVLIAGRWYSSTSLKDGEWTFVEPKNLPEDFANIPEDSDMSEIRINIPGTPEAQEALLAQSIPQTAAVDRKEATIEVKFDGEPKFEKIEGTEITYAANCDKTVMRITNKYYCVDNGIWFVSDSPKGPYVVSDTRPDEVDAIPPDSPVYNTKYVYIYDSTPEVVYVGYTPGYMYSYSYGGVVVYGTGYAYPYWYGSVYYPRPVTYGYGVHYNPWTGWGFSVGISYGWVGWGYHPYYRPYWGPAGYHAGYRHGYHHGYHNGYNHGYHNGYRAGYAAANRNNGNRNVYKQQRGVKPTTRPSAGTRPSTASRPSKKPNNVYTDKSGNVYQRDKSGSWNQKTKGSQRPSTMPSSRPSSGNASRPSTGSASRPSTQPSSRPSTQPSTRPSTRPSTMPSNSGLNQSYQNRSRGQQNHQNYQRSSSPSRNYSRPSSGGSRGGGSRGGGGRRR